MDYYFLPLSIQKIIKKVNNPLILLHKVIPGVLKHVLEGNGI